MGRVAVREALHACLAEAQLPHVGTVFAARPQIVQEEDYELAEQAYVNNRLIEATPTTAGSNAVLVINLTGNDRKRRALTGRGAVNDTNIHRTELEVYLANTGGQAVQAQVDYDGIIDSITELVRDNPTLSAPEVIWSSGEYDNGVQHQQALPFTSEDGTTVFIHGLVSWQVWEWISGPTGYTEPAFIPYPESDLYPNT